MLPNTIILFMSPNVSGEFIRVIVDISLGDLMRVLCSTNTKIAGDPGFCFNFGCELQLLKGW